MSLDLLMQRTALKLEVISSVDCTVMGDYTTHGKAEDSQPKWSFAPHLHYLARYERADTDEQRRRVVWEAVEELRALRYSKSPAVDLKTREGRLRVGLDPRPVSVVAAVYGYSERQVKRIRAEAKHTINNLSAHELKSVTRALGLVRPNDGRRTTPASRLAA